MPFRGEAQTYQVYFYPPIQAITGFTMAGICPKNRATISKAAGIHFTFVDLASIESTKSGGKHEKHSVPQLVARG